MMRTGQTNENSKRPQAGPGRFQVSNPKAYVRKVLEILQPNVSVDSNTVHRQISFENDKYIQTPDVSVYYKRRSKGKCAVRAARP